MSNYCALDDAFQEIGSSPSPGCNVDYSTKASRKEERRKARRTKGPTSTYFDIPSKVDPDREQYQRADQVPAMNSDTGMTEYHGEYFIHHNNTKLEQDIDDKKVVIPNFDKDPMKKYIEDQIRSKYVVMPMPSDKLSQPFKNKSFFGADPDSDNYANYMPDQEDYKLQPDFMTAFEHAGVARAGSMAQVPDPNKNMFWKPTTTQGAQSSFIEHLPPKQGRSMNHSMNGSEYDDYNPKEIMKRMDKIFAKLDDMNQVSPEQVTSELLMFISSGIFVVFMMDLLVRKGSKMRF
jgi:hypothetical protein